MVILDLFHLFSKILETLVQRHGNVSVPPIPVKLQVIYPHWVKLIGLTGEIPDKKEKISRLYCYEKIAFNLDH